jgi:hypothetical protein
VAAGEVRPENQFEAANSAFSGVFGNCGSGIKRFFLNILLKSGTYGRLAGQYTQQNLSTGTQSRDRDSHRLAGRGSQYLREEFPSHFPSRWPRERTLISTMYA